MVQLFLSALVLGEKRVDILKLRWIVCLVDLADQRLDEGDLVRLLLLLASRKLGFDVVLVADSQVERLFLALVLFEDLVKVAEFLLVVLRVNIADQLPVLLVAGLGCRLGAALALHRDLGLDLVLVADAPVEKKLATLVLHQQAVHVVKLGRVVLPVNLADEVADLARLLLVRGPGPGRRLPGLLAGHARRDALPRGIRPAGRRHAHGHATGRHARWHHARRHHAGRRPARGHHAARWRRWRWRHRRRARRRRPGHPAGAAHLEGRRHLVLLADAEVQCLLSATVLRQQGVYVAQL
mmetsp:Transcript_11106/g.32534  ORF Transcript_11106/g.32534 Transcript_11106/m.32534 type:complete len:296 (-) Transcript_11106:107-994(-)